jgi:F-type H+-transporting ATPase subunit b
MLFASAAGGSSGNGGNFLIPNGTFIVELVIFLVVLGIIAKWILPPLQEVTETRRARILGELAKAEESRAAAKDILAERDRVIQLARVKARDIVDLANQGADSALEQGRARGQREYERLVEASRAEVTAECGRAREELIARLDSLVVSAAERVLNSHIDPNEHRELIHEAVAAAGAPGPQRGAV